jgi:N4-gp56 family major capsid protein
MANEIVASTTSSDREKFLASKLINRAHLRLVAASVCKKISQPKGTGLTAYFVRYNRMQLPTSTLSEGVAPSNSTFDLSEYTVTLDQWGAVITLTDIVQLTTKHPVLQQAIDLLADNAARVMDREIQLVWLANTNIQYGDGSVAARNLITTSMKISESVLQKVRVTMEDAGATARQGPSFSEANADSVGSMNGGQHYLLICGPQVHADLMVSSASFGSWASVATYNRAMALYNAEVGTFQGFRVVVTNFIPKLNIYGNGTAAVASAANMGVTGFSITAAAGSTGTLAQSTTYYWKVTRKSLQRGFEEDISIEHTTASTGAGGATQYFTFAFPSTAGYVYNVYFGSATGDSNLKLAGQNIAAGGSLQVDAVPSSTTTAPASLIAASTPTLHVVWVHADESCLWVGLQNLQTYTTGGAASISDPLAQLTKVGYKFMAKAIVPDSTRLLRLEVASNF